MQKEEPNCVAGLHLDSDDLNSIYPEGCTVWLKVCLGMRAGSYLCVEDGRGELIKQTVGIAWKGIYVKI